MGAPALVGGPGRPRGGQGGGGGFLGYMYRYGGPVRGVRRVCLAEM